MEIALPGVIVFLIITPGFIFRAQFKRAERETFDYSPFGRVVGQAFFWVVILHGVWLLATWLLFKQVLDVRTLLQLLSSLKKDTLEVIYRDQLKITAYFVSLYMFCWLAPPYLREVIIEKRLDRIDSKLSWMLRFDAPWYYILHGADQEKKPDLIFVSAIVVVGDLSVLYRGALVDYIVNRHDGELDRLILRGVYRWNMKDLDASLSEQEIMDKSIYIASNAFVISYDETVTLSIDYMYEVP
ncbi:hypothetical protein [Pseudomonas sp. NPDC089569]|uniref:hypothetical protein n=1 Tax=Pseudomonas sp. NPDC089569 TaxID=3390722 RepID=UPI003D060275